MPANSFPELSRDQVEALLLLQNARVAKLEKALALALPYVEHAASAAPTTPTRLQRKHQAERDAAAVRTALKAPEQAVA
jgi:hypothetical protein